MYFVLFYFILICFYFICIDDEAGKVLKMFREKRDETARMLNLPELQAEGKYLRSILNYDIWLYIAYDNIRIVSFPIVVFFLFVFVCKYFFSTFSSLFLFFLISAPYFYFYISIFIYLYSIAYPGCLTNGASPKAVSAEDILIAEGSATLELADQQVWCNSIIYNRQCSGVINAGFIYPD